MGNKRGTKPKTKAHPELWERKIDETVITNRSHSHKPFLGKLQKSSKKRKILQGKQINKEGKLLMEVGTVIT